MEQKLRQEYKDTPQDRDGRLSSSAHEKSTSHWPPTTKQLGWTIAVLLFLAISSFLIYLGYGQGQEWTGFGESIREKETTTQDLRREKTLWDWMQLLIIPVAVAVGTFVLNQTAKKREEQRQQQQKESELEVQEQRAQDDALQAYLDQMGDLMLNRGLAPSPDPPLDAVSTLARARTLTVLRRLGRKRKRSVLDFLYESKLITVDESSTVDLGGLDVYGGAADLSNADLVGDHLAKANLHGANLNQADLQGANLKDANLSGTSLRGAKLGGADLQGAELYSADLTDARLTGADLQSAKLGGANLSGIDLRRAEDPTGEAAAELEAAGLPKEKIEQAMRGKANLESANLHNAKGIISDRRRDEEITIEDLEQRVSSLKGAIMPDGSTHN